WQNPEQLFVAQELINKVKSKCRGIKGKKNFYVNSMNVNDTDYTKNYLRHKDLFKGGTIKVDMSNRPNKNRGTKEEDMPYSFSKEQ
ncbi:glycoside hydrolase family 92 protein, partial [Bacteroides ovatus]|uniref:glycoside hydrolase domain-containing protein n=1 Tax=Bacteroides ovatus TaxID=28116 RepID=UPI00233F634F